MSVDGQIATHGRATMDDSNNSRPWHESISQRLFERAGVKPYYADDSVLILHGDCREIVPALGEVGQIVTSPPFNAGHEYERSAWKSLAAYERFTGQWVRVCAAALRPGGWFCVEVQDMHVSPEHSHALPGQTEGLSMATHARIIMAMIRSGLLFKSSAVWNRGRWSGDASRLICAPGSPALLEQHSNLLFARKPGGRPGAYEFPELDAPTKSLWCRSVWDHVTPERHDEHPAVMPLEMAQGFINCWSLPPDTILDPFMGTGTTVRAAKNLGRRAIGIEIEEKSCAIAARRMQQSVLPLFVDRDGEPNGGNHALL